MINMELPRTEPLKWPFCLIVKASLLNALLVTLISAGTIALLSGVGNGVEDWSRRSIPPPQGSATHNILGSLLEVGKAAVWLCPITAVTCGSFGLLAAFAGGSLMYLRARRIRSTGRFLVETVIVGLILGCLFPVFDLGINRAFGMNPYYESNSSIQRALAPIFGAWCAFMCALVCLKRVMARTRRQRRITQSSSSQA